MMAPIREQLKGEFEFRILRIAVSVLEYEYGLTGSEAAEAERVGKIVEMLKVYKFRIERG